MGDLDIGPWRADLPDALLQNPNRVGVDVFQIVPSPVVMESIAPPTVERFLPRPVFHRRHGVHDRLSECRQYRRPAQAIRSRAAITHCDGGNRPPHPLFRDHRDRRREAQKEPRGQLIRKIRPQLAVPRHQFRQFIEREINQPRHHHWPDGMQREIHGRDHAEIPSAALQTPKQVGVLFFARHHDIARGRYYLSRAQIVAAQAGLSVQPSESTTQREPGQTGHGNNRPRRGQSKGLRHLIKMRPRQTRLRFDGTDARIHLDGLHTGHVQQQTAFGRRMTRHMVAATFDGQFQLLLTREPNCDHHIGSGSGPNYNCGTPVKRPVPDFPGGVKTLIRRPEYGAVDKLAKRANQRHGLEPVV